jgi:hypothetical protein
MRKGVVAVLLALSQGLVPQQAEAAFLLRIDEVRATRGSDNCTPIHLCTSRFSLPPVIEREHPSCGTAMLASRMISGPCHVYVLGVMSGFARSNSRISVTFSMMHQTGKPWQAAPQDAVPQKADTDQLEAQSCSATECDEGTPKVWRWERNYKVDYSGAFAAYAVLAFPASGLDAECENFLVRADLRSGKKRTSENLGTVKLCA